jgi:hypothetical protein
MPLTHYSKFSWQIFHIVGLCVFSHQSADYSIVVAHLTSNSFEGHPCCMHADYYTPAPRRGREVYCFTSVRLPVDLPRSGKPRVTSDRDDRALQRLVRWMPFATSPVLKQHWLPNRCLSTRTVRNRLKSAGLKSRKVIHHKGQLAGCSLGYRLYFCVTKPSSGRRLHEAETDSRLTNGSCAMSLNSIRSTRMANNRYA